MVRLKPDPTETDPAGTDRDGAWSDGLQSFVTTGPADPAFMILVGQLEALGSIRHSGLSPDPAAVRAALDRLSGYFLTSQGEPRKRLAHAKAVFPSPRHWKRHRDLVVASAPRVAAVLTAYRRDVNALLARGVWRIFRIAEAEYRRTLDAHGVLDFSDLLLKTRQLLGQMEEFARSRYKLESRYHHVLVDEFQDTSRAQWELVSLLVQSWGEGAGLAGAAPLPPSIFIVGDSKQSIYSFRDADVSVLADAARALEGLRPDGDVRRSISRSFRSVPALLSFVNDVCHDLDKAQGRTDAFRYDERDVFPVGVSTGGRADVLGAIVAEGPQLAAEAVADEVHRLVATGTLVRDVTSALPRPVVASDIAILFRTRESHRAIEEALVRRHVPAYVYKGLGFFDTSEIRDVLATLWHLAEPCSNLRAAAWLRSGVVRLSDEGLRRLGPELAEVLSSPVVTSAAQSLDDTDTRTLARAREASARWRARVDRITPSELIDLVLSDSAYSIEMRGYRFRQARENLKKIRSLVRRIQRKGSATLTRIVSHLDRLALGDESNAPIDARGAVNLMTVHAAKGLEFPVVFVVNLTTGTGGRRPGIHLMDRPDGQASISIGDFDSTLDEEDAARAREDTKRLLYVALTRARDRLYLSAPARNGLLQPGRGSLADVLPPSLLAVLGKAGGGTSITWQASSGAIHAFRACAGPSVQALGNPQFETEPPVEAARPDETDFLPLEAPRETDPFPGDSPDVRIACRLVHRLLGQLGLPREARDGGLSLADQVERLLEPGERELVDPAQLVAEVCATYESLAGRSDVAAFFENGEAFYEVPISFVVDDAPVTASVGCLIRTPDGDARGQAGGTFTILDFRTSPPRPGDREEMRTLHRAVSDAFPGVPVRANLVYRTALVPV
jgi:ATP-dependent helicase/nuclease subunit A